MYDDDNLEVSVPQPRGGPSTSTGPTAYCPARFPTKNISSPIVLFYGDSDSLIDIDRMSNELPDGVTAIPLKVSISIASRYDSNEQLLRVTSTWMCSGEETSTRTSFLESLRHYTVTAIVPRRSKVMPKV